MMRGMRTARATAGAGAMLVALATAVGVGAGASGAPRAAHAAAGSDLRVDQQPEPAPRAAHAAAGWYLLVNEPSNLALQVKTPPNGAAVVQVAWNPGVEPPQSMQWLIVDRGNAPNGHALKSLRNAATSSQYALAISA